MNKTHTLNKCCEHWIEYLGKMVNYCPECGTELAHTPLTAILKLDCLEGKMPVLQFHPEIKLPLIEQRNFLIFKFERLIDDVTAEYLFYKLETI